MEPIQIEGTIGEGGGSILRLSAGFSVLFNKPIHVKNIRANRSNPGLRLQHLLGLEALRDITNGKLTDIEVGSKELKFFPGSDSNANINVNIRTAGSIGLLSQTLHNAMIYSEQIPKLEVKVNGGGTFGLGAPDPYYLNNVTYYYFKKMGYDCSIDVIKNGYYPKGGAMANLTYNPIKNIEDKLKPLNLDSQGNLSSIKGNIIVSQNLRKPKVAERIHSTIIDNLINKLNLTQDYFNIKLQYVNTLNPGVGLSLWTEYDSGVRLGSATILGKRGVSSEEVGMRAVQSLLSQMNTTATVDEYLSDQIIPLLYLCKEPVKIYVPKISSHMQTNIDILNLFEKRAYSIQKVDNAWEFYYK